MRATQSNMWATMMGQSPTSKVANSSLTKAQVSIKVQSPTKKKETNSMVTMEPLKQLVVLK